MPRKCFKCFLCLFLAVFVVFLIVLVRLGVGPSEVFNEDIVFDDIVIDDNSGHGHGREHSDKISKSEITEPIILWWTPFTGDSGTYKTCGNVKCFFTNNRLYKDHSQAKAFMFYGTDFKVNDLPVPRKPDHYWALLHEESPKNNYLFSHAEVMDLFNFTSTFRRESSYPISTQYVNSIEWLEDKKYLLPTKDKNLFLKDLSPIIYTQSDCDVPSGRDQYTKLLMHYTNIDSYGTCLHNKDLPQNLRDPIEGMDHDEFFKLNAKYKFSLAMENGLCPDYMTEKLWRPFHLGSVPIILGSPKVKDFLPSNHSAIVIDDFKSVQELAKYITFLNENDTEYDKYLEWKRTGVQNLYLKKIIKEREWHVQNDWGKQEINFIEGFQCYVCRKLNENIKNQETYQANKDHYGCPGPVSFDSNGQRLNGGGTWDYEFKRSHYIAKATNILVNSGKSFTASELSQLANKIKDELR